MRFLSPHISCWVARRTPHEHGTAALVALTNKATPTPRSSPCHPQRTMDFASREMLENRKREDHTSRVHVITCTWWKRVWAFGSGKKTTVEYHHSAVVARFNRFPRGLGVIIGTDNHDTAVTKMIFPSLSSKHLERSAVCRRRNQISPAADALARSDTIWNSHSPFGRCIIGEAHFGAANHWPDAS
jgi:hypothetical protein